MRWRVGNGSFINFWIDWWFRKQLRLEDDIVIPGDIDSIKLSECILADRSWDVVKLQELLPMNNVEEIRATPIPLIDYARDAMAWVGSNSGSFSVRSAYEAIVGDRREDKSWTWIL